MRKVVLSIMVILAISCVANAATTYTEWRGTGAGVGNWNDTTWTVAWGHVGTDLNGVAGSPNWKAGFKTPGKYPAMTSGTYSCDIMVFGGANTAGLDDLVMNGATLNVSEYVTMAAGSTDVGQMVINSGTINTGVNVNNPTFYVTQLGTGKLTMNGGYINVGLPNRSTWTATTVPSVDYYGNFSMTGTGATSSGTLYLNGGIISANDLLKGSGTALLVIDGSGMIVLNGDKRTEIAGYVTAGWLRGANNAAIQTSFDDLAGTTTVFVPEPATVCLLGLGVLGLIRRK